MKKSFTLIMLLMISFIPSAIAVPITYSMTANPNSLQDPYVDGWTHELGIFFPSDEAISASYQLTNLIACPQTYSGGVNFLITITNASNRDWTNLAYVSDLGTNISNDDTFLVNDEEAFYIDSVGFNTPLVSESMTLDHIFEAGETWQFVLQDYTNILGLPPTFLASWNPVNCTGLIGCQSTGVISSSGSIIANPVPEPATFWMVGLGCLALFKRKA